MFVDFITDLIQPIVKIRRDEWFKAGFMFLYSFFIFATLYILKPVRSSLYLDTHGAENLWIGYIVEGILLFFVTWIYVRFAKQFKNKSDFFTFTTVFLISNILGFWVFFKFHMKVSWFVLLFYGWVATYSVTVATQFWTMANDIFNPEEAKRLFGFIISGGSLGGIVGGFITNFFAERFGTENLLLLTGAFLTAAVIVSRAVWKHEKPVLTESYHETAIPGKERAGWIIQLFLKSRYLLLITALVLIAKVIETIVDNLFNGIVDNTILKKNELTAFFGAFFAWLNAVSFFLQLFITSKVLRHLGIGISLLLLPIGLLIGAGVSIFVPILSVAVATRIYDGGLSYSINLLSKEILYLPIASDVRYRVKPIIDMLFFRQSKFLAGIIIFIALKLLGLKVQQLGIIIVVMIPFWIWIALQVRHGYMEAIKQLLTNRKRAERFTQESQKSATDVLMNLFEEKSFQTLKNMLNQVPSPVRKMSAAACLAFYGGGKDVSRVRKLVEEMVHYEALELQKEDWIKDAPPQNQEKSHWIDDCLFRFLKAGQSTGSDLEQLIGKEEAVILPKLTECLQNSNGDMLLKRKAISLLKLIGTQRACDILLLNIENTFDNSLRSDTIHALNRIRSKHKERTFHTLTVEKEIFYETSNHKSILTLIEYYRKNTKAALNPDEDFLLAALRTIQEESLERIFRLLGLLYHTEATYVIYDRILEDESDSTVRAHAIELLENMIKPDLFKLLLPVIDQNRWQKEKREDAQEIVKRFLLGQDRWFSVCAIFLVAELKMKELYPLLDQIILSKISIVKEAAEIAKKKLELPDNTVETKVNPNVSPEI